MYSYNYSYGYDPTSAFLSTPMIILSLIVAAISIVSMWKLFMKADEPGWASIIPFYNMYILFKITWGSGIKFLFLLIPFANIVFAIITYVKLAKVFGKGGGFAVGLVLLPVVFMPILAFGDSRYLGVQGSNRQPVQ